jgi:hypothetical protein
LGFFHTYVPDTGGNLFGEVEGNQPGQYRHWVRSEALMWWFNRNPVNQPLVTTGPLESLGILGNPGTTVLAGHPGIDYGLSTGAAVTAGFWLDPGGHIALEAGWMGFVDKASQLSYSAQPDGFPVLSRPVINALTGDEGVSPISLPGINTGGAVIQSSIDFMSAEANILGSEWRSDCFSLDVLVGFRYLQLMEGMSITSTNAPLPGFSVPFAGALYNFPSVVTIWDNYKTVNHFYGGQIGLRGELHFGRVYLDVEGKLAMGTNQETLRVSGNTALTGPGGPREIPAGLLALSTNSKLDSLDEFVLIPELKIRFGVCITQHIGLFMGYTLLYWPDAARSGNQIDRVVDPTLIPSNLSYGTGSGQTRPQFIFNKADFWAHGVHAGFEIRY